mgnify:CR=1 FL=1
MTESLQRLRRLSLHLFLIFLAISALIAIATVLAGSFGWFEARVLITTFVISACSIACMACAAFAQITNRVELAVGAGLLCLGSSVLILVGAWWDIDVEAFWKTTFVLNSIAVGSVHAMLLAMGRVAQQQRWIQVGGEISIGLLVLLIAMAVVGEITDVDYYKLVAVVAIVVALATLVVPILHRMQGREPAREKLVLQRDHDDIFRDPGGRRFRLIPLDEDG